MIKDLGKHHTVILSSHILSEVSAVCDFVMIISRGELVASDTPDNLSKLVLGSNVLELTVKGAKEKVEQILKGMEQIREFEIHSSTTPDCVAVTIKTNEMVDLREDLSYEFAGERCPILEMKQSNMSLEDVFLELTAEQPKAEKERFFSNVFVVYSAIAFVVASGVILTAQISTRMLAAPAYYEAWHYVPVLTLATTFACLGSFLSSIYMVEQRSAATLVTTMLGAAANVVGNLILIPLWGSMGAALSTLFSYILIFGVRAVHTRSMLRIHWDIPKAAASVLLLVVQCLLIERAVPLWPLWSVLCFLGVTAVNFQPLWSALQKAVHH